MKLRTIFVLIILCFQFGCNQKLENNTDTKTSLKEEIEILSNASSFHKAKVADEAKVEQNTKNIEIFEDKPEAILKQPMPNFTFNFPCETKSEKICNEDSIKSELPKEGIEVVEKFWKETIKIHYLEIAKGSELSYERVLELIDLHQKAGDEFEDEIRKVKINAPDGIRNISDFEADQMIILVISFADEVINSVVKSKDSKQYHSA